MMKSYNYYVFIYVIIVRPSADISTSRISTSRVQNTYVTVMIEKLRHNNWKRGIEVTLKMGRRTVKIRCT